MIDREYLHTGISNLRFKISDFEKTKQGDDCVDCFDASNSKEVYDLWMDVFVLIKEVCDSSLELGRTCYSPDIHFLDECMSDIDSVLSSDFISTMPNLFKVCLEQYLPNYISLLNGVECLDSLHSKVLLLKGKVIPSPSTFSNCLAV